MFYRNSMLPEAAPPSFERPIDLVHLARQTLGDRDLEREVLGLFVVQARSVLDMLGAARDQRQRGDLAHTLKGSARSIGAWRVAAKAETCEQLIAANDASWQAALDELTASVREAIGAIDTFHAAA
ncbi:MAG TPA: Hpt domain-containing protein [Rhabdaerophilum sp.]|nr:Hpt domain-containing protein [Rhabdaerophilum sp.]